MDQRREGKLVDRADTQRHHNSHLGEVLWLVMGALKTWQKTALVPEKEEKGELSLGPMVTSGWKSKDYSAPAEESVSLVGKSMVLPETTSGGYAPHTAGVAQMKLEAPPQYSGKRQPGARVWLTQMERYMRLMRYAPTDWLDVVAMRVEGAASSWVNAVLQEISEGRRPFFRTWAQFRDAMVQRFEPVTKVEEARKQLRALRQTGRVVGYVQKFQELQYRLPGMIDEEAFHAFISGLQPHLQEHVGAHVQGDLEAAIAMAQRLEVYHSGDGAKTSGKRTQKVKIPEKGKCDAGRWELVWGDRPGGLGREKAAKEGQG